jgi:hypothetical protein
MSFNELGIWGNELAEKLTVLGATKSESDSICEKFGQYCFQFGIKHEWVEEFVNMYKKSDPILQLPTIEFAQFLINKWKKT